MSLPPLVEPVAALSEDERARTARHAVLDGFGEIAQRRLAAAHVALVGAGGLGSPALLALAAAGVGTLTVIDDDAVDATNLQRQVMHRIGDVGTPKADSAVRAAAELSPATRVIPAYDRLIPGNAERLLAGADVVLDGSDTFDTREAVAAACERLGTPLVWGTVQEFDAQMTVFWSDPPTGHEPVRLADLYPPGSMGEVPTCAQVGVLGALCMQVGALMATEAIKLITGTGEPLLGRMLLVDALRARQREVPLRPAPAHARSPEERQTSAARAVPAPAKPAADPAPVPAVDPDELSEALQQGEVSTVLDVREPFETNLGTVRGSVLIPLGEVLADPAGVCGRIGSGRTVVVCEAGVRARQAAQALGATGLEVAVLDGGISSWRSAGHPLHVAAAP